jgi:regulator of sirC expression with transglutaminase-like and TPR domain
MDLDAALAALADDPASPVDVAAVALHLARDEYPDLDVAPHLDRLDRLAETVKPRLRGDLTARTRALAAFLFDEEGFRGNAADYYDPRNSYLNEVLDRRLGLPITLAVLAMAVGARAGLEVVGVGLPGHFVAKAVGRGGPDVLFDPFHAGRLLTPGDCARLVREVTGLSFCATPERLAAAPPGLIVQRLLTNLKGIYLRGGDHARAARVLGRLCQLAPGDAPQRRELGLSLVEAGCPGRAIDHLRAYLARVPDDATARRALEVARGDLARWN